MSSSLNQEGRDAVPASSDPRYARRVDMLDELQRALDATRIAAASHQAPPLMPGPEEDGALEADEAPGSVAQPSHGFKVEAASAQERLGMIAARATAEQFRERQQREEHPVPDFLRNARPYTRPTLADTKRAGYRPPREGRHNPLAASREHGDHDNEVHRRLQPPRPVPQHQPAKRRWRTLVGFSALASLIVCSAGFLGDRFFIAPADNAASDAPRMFLASSSFFKSSDRVADTNAPTLVLSAVSAPPNRLVGLGVNIDGASAGASVVIRGLQPGSRVTAGVSAGEGAWRVPIGDLPKAAVVPPQDFVGTMELAVDLRRGDDSIADSNVHQITWTSAETSLTDAKPVKTTTISASPDIFPPPLPKPQRSAPQTNGSRASSYDETQRGDVGREPSPRQLDPEELRNLIERGDAALQRGDIAAARLLLRRAAEAGDVTAAMALGAIYDPGVLAQLGAMGAKGDIEVARNWYQKAADGGSSDAKRRLQELTQR